KYFDKGDLRFLPDKAVYQLALKDKKGAEMVFEGKRDKKGRLTLDRTDASSGDSQRLEMYTAAEGIRFLYDYSQKPKGTTLFRKVFQVASNKEGQSLAARQAMRECVVTGGLGTMAVSYNGKTYYVCCSGCRDEFNANPEKYVKAFEAKKAGGE